MSGSVLLDTNIVIALFAKDQSVIDNLAKAEEVFFPSVVFGELYYGAENSSRSSENIAKVDALVLSSTILRCDSVTARYYGQIKRQLKVSGSPIPENDIWIAAIAMQNGLTLITRDNHFASISGLSVGKW